MENNDDYMTRGKGADNFGSYVSTEKYHSGVGLNQLIAYWIDKIEPTGMESIFNLKSLVLGRLYKL